MKKGLWMMAAAMLLTPGGALAGFFGPSAPVGSVELKMSSDASIYVKDGFVFPSVSWFVYDTSSHIAAFAAGNGPAGRAAANSLSDRGKGHGRIAILMDNEIRSILDSMAAKPNLWAKYLEGGDDSCANEKSLLADLKLKTTVKENLIATSCTGLRSKVNVVLGGLDASEKQDISGGDTDRGRLTAALGLLPVIGTPFKVEYAIEAIKQARKPETVATLERLFSDFPPEGEVVPLIERKEMIVTGHRRLPPTAIWGATTVAVEKQEKWLEPAISPHEVFKTPEAQAFLGNLAYTEAGDFIVDQLRNFDYPLSHPSLNPNFTTEGRQGWLAGPNIQMVKSHLPRPMYAWSIFKNNQDGLNVEEPNWLNGQENVGRFISFPFLPDDVGLPQYRTAWITWHNMLQKEVLSKDEIRKLVLFADSISGSQPNEQFEGVADPFKATRIRPMEPVKYPSFMGYFAAKAVAPVNMRAINLPSEWDVANYQTTEPDLSNPGLTVGRWFVAVLAAAGEKANSNPEFVAFTKALFAGDTANCKAIINRAVSDEALAKVVRKAKSDLAKSDLSDGAKSGLTQALTNNPTKLYKQLGDSIVKIYSTGGKK